MDYSIIIPVYNEQDTVLPLYFSLKSVMDKLKKPYEVIFVDDGSTDKSVDQLKSINHEPANLTIISLSDNGGISVAMQAAFDVACGRIIITLDSDMQINPEDIPALLAKMQENYDMIYGWRYLRMDPVTKKVVSKIANMIRRTITGDKIHDAGCGLRVFKRAVLKNIYLSGGLHRFFSTIITRLGYKVGEVKIRHNPRRFGVSKFGVWKRFLEGGIDLFRICFIDVRKLVADKPNYVVKEIIRK